MITIVYYYEVISELRISHFRYATVCEGSSQLHVSVVCLTEVKELE